MNQISGPRELTGDEIHQVSGGLLPIIAALIAAAKTTAGRVALQQAVSYGASLYGVYQAGTQLTSGD